MFRGFDNEIVLKKAGAADAKTAAYTHAVAWQQSYRGTFDEAYLLSKSVEVRKQEFISRISADSYFDYLIYKKQIPIGILILEADSKNVLEIESLYILEAFRNVGAGSAALAFVVKTAEALGKRKISLWTLECNKRARRFYEQNNFVVTGEKRTIYRGDSFTQIKSSRLLSGRVEEK